MTLKRSKISVRPKGIGAIAVSLIVVGAGLLLPLSSASDSVTWPKENPPQNIDLRYSLYESDPPLLYILSNSSKKSLNITFEQILVDGKEFEVQEYNVSGGVKRGAKTPLYCNGSIVVDTKFARNYTNLASQIENITEQILSFTMRIPLGPLLYLWVVHPFIELPISNILHDIVDFIFIILEITPSTGEGELSLRTIEGEHKVTAILNITSGDGIAIEGNKVRVTGGGLRPFIEIEDLELIEKGGKWAKVNFTKTASIKTDDFKEESKLPLKEIAIGAILIVLIVSAVAVATVLMRRREEEEEEEE